MSNNYRVIISGKIEEQVIVKRSILGSALMYYYSLPFVALGFLGIFPTAVKPLSGHPVGLIRVMIAISLPWVVFILAPRTWVYVVTEKSRWWQRVHAMGGVIIGIALVHYLAVFGGIPKLVHYAGNVDGTLITTITEKSDWEGRFQRCKPSVHVKAIAWPFFGHLCVSQTFYDSVRVGDRVRVIGKVSSYAIEPIQIEPLAINAN